MPGRAQVGWWFGRVWILALILGLPALADATGGRRVAIRQYTSTGHVLGFGAGGYYVSNGAYAVRVEFSGAAQVEPADEGTEGRTAGGAAPLGAVKYAGLWEGIDVTYDAPGAGIVRSTWHVAAGADPGAIRLRYNRAVRRGADGGLEVDAYATGALSESAPVAWQEVKGERRPVEVSFAIRGRDEVGFAVGAYDRARPLVIDPTLLWNTFLGGSDNDAGRGVALDGSGNVYVVGSSESTWGSPVQAFSAAGDAFAAKLDATGALVWNTFLGGSGSELGIGIALDGSGNVYVAGTGGATWGSPVRAYTASDDTFAARLDSSGALVWNTFLGGSGSDFGQGIGVDGSGNVYVAGTSDATWGSPVQAFTASLNDAFAAKLDASGALLWNTFLGGSGSDSASGIAADGSGNAYVIGGSDATWGSPVRAYTAAFDAFAAKVSASGALLWNTFLGGSGADRGRGITVDGSGNVYTTAESNATWGSPVRAFTGADDSSVAKLDSSGALLWNTFLGGAGEEETEDVAVDGSGNVYVTGQSSSTWGSPVPAYTAAIDAYAARLNSSGALVWNAFVGGSGDDRGRGIAVDGSGNVYLAGTSDATWGSPVRAYTAGDDAFVAAIGELSVLEIPTLSGAGLAALVLLVAAAAIVALRWGGPA